MITCPNCNKELSDGSKFCDGCGTQIPETVFCPNCGEQASTEFAFCQGCGASLTAAPAEEPAVEEQTVEFYEEENEIAPEGKGKSAGKAIGLIALGVAAVAALVLVCSLLFGGGSNRINHALYLKDENMYFSTLKKNKEPLQVTDKLADSDDYGKGYFANLGDDLANFVHMDEGSKYLFFPDKSDFNDDGGTLYYREIGKSKADAVKIDSNIVYYAVDTATSVVTYLKADDEYGTLYQYSIKKDDSKKIAKDVSEFYVTDDGKKVVYLCNPDAEDGQTTYDLCIQYIGKEAEKLCSGVTSLRFVSEDFKTFYYVKDGDTLYKHVEGKEKEKIESNIYSVIKVYESGEIYYVTAEDEEYSLADFIDGDEDSYYTDEDLEDATVDYNVKTLHFYDGKKSTVVAEGYSDWSDYAIDTPVIAYSACDLSNVEKIDSSDVEYYLDYGDYEEAIDYALSSSGEKYIAVKAAATVIEQDEEATIFSINDEGTVAYYMDNVDWEVKENEGACGDLYRVSISKKSAGKAEKYDSDVYVYSRQFTENGEYVYCKDVKKGHGELYIDKNKISDDVYVDSIDTYSHPNNIYFFTDMSDDEPLGTLNVYNGKKSTKIADDVYSYQVDPDGRVVYLYDYDTEDNKGELHEWVNGKDKKISDDVYAYEFSVEGDVLYLYDYKKHEGELHIWSNGKSRKLDEDVAGIVPAYTPVFEENEEEYVEYHYWPFGY